MDDATPILVGAGLLRRLGAMAYDALLVLGVWMVTLYLLVRVNQGEAVQGAWLQSILFLEAFGYFAWSWLRSGQTVGMLAWRLELISCHAGLNEQPRNRRISLLQACLRTLGFLVGMLPAGLGYLLLLFDSNRRALPDRLSDSLVIFNPEATLTHSPESD